MKRSVVYTVWSFLLMGALLLSLASCTVTPPSGGGTTPVVTTAAVTTAEPPPVVNPPKQGDVSEGCKAVIKEMEFGFYEAIKEDALNAHKLEDHQDANHIPIRMISSNEEDSAFIHRATDEEWGVFENNGQAIGGNLNNIIDYDKSRVFVVAIEASSGSFEYGFDSIIVEETTLTVHFKQLYYDPDLDFTTDIAYWMGWVTVPLDILTGITEIDAVLEIEQSPQ